jgi:hypothetical protein
MEEMRQLLSKRSGESTPRLQHKGQKEAATTGTDAIRPGDFLKCIEDAVSEADKSLVRAASNQEALFVDIGLLVADLNEVSLTAKITRIHMLIVCHRKPVFSKSLVWSSRAPSGNVS